MNDTPQTSLRGNRIKGEFVVRLALILIWCILLRQSLHAMPWDTHGTWLYPLKRPLAYAGLSIGSLGAACFFGSLFWLFLTPLVGAEWGRQLSPVLRTILRGSFFPFLLLLSTCFCSASLLFPEIARYWGVDSPDHAGIRPFGVLNADDPGWWTPFCLYLRLGLVSVLGFVLRSLCLKSHPTHAEQLPTGTAAVGLILTVMSGGFLGFDLLAGTSGIVLSLFPVTWICFSALLALAVALLQSSLFRPFQPTLSGGRPGAMLTAMVLLQGYLIYSQWMITWYAHVPRELKWYHFGQNRPVFVSASLLLSFVLPLAVLLFPKARRSPRALGAVSAALIIGMASECVGCFFAASLPPLTVANALPSALLLLLVLFMTWCTECRFFHAHHE